MAAPGSEALPPAPAGRASTEARTRGQLANQIANGLVRLWRERAGVGPQRARAHVTETAVTCLMEGTLTAAERTLAASGRSELVRRQRDELRGVLRDDASELVQRVTGRRVLCMLGDTSVEPDHAVDVFVLGGPVADGPGSVGGDRDGHPRAAPVPLALEVHVREEGRAVHIRPAGDLDLAGVSALAESIEAARATGKAIVLELDGLDFLDSSGLNLILATWEAARRDGTPFTLTPGRANVQRVFRVAGLDDVLPFERRR
jgi:anti-sigma B factor antagonist